MNMSTQLLYNDFPTFFAEIFSLQGTKISLNAGFTCPNRDGTKDGADVHIAITRLLIRITAGQRSLSLPNWKKEMLLPINIRK